MSKKKILVLPSDKGGVGKYRSVDPHVRLQELYPEDYHIDINYNFDFSNLTKLKEYDMVHVHKVPYNRFETATKLIGMIKALNIKLVVDIDDYWNLPTQHPSYRTNIHHKHGETVVQVLKAADYITTTTPLFVNFIKKFNKNVHVISNAINTNEPQYNVKPTESEFDVRFGWLGGSSHDADLELLRGLTGRFSQLKNSQLVLCGFDLRGVKNVINKETGQVHQAPLEPQETAWYRFEKLFTHNYQDVNPIFKAELETYKEDVGTRIDQSYRRIWTRPLNKYLGGYNEFDVSLAPLVEHDFNKCKSQLKVIEAGFFKKAIIAQDFGPYQLDIENGKNGILIETRKNHKDWFKKAKMLVDNPNMITDLGEALYDTVKDKYDLNNVTKTRHQIYQEILQ